MPACLTPRIIYTLLVLLGIGLALVDHLGSQSLAGVGSPVDLGNACAPCGAPCTE